MHLRDRPAPVSIPLVAPDADALLDLKDAIDRVWTDSCYYLRIKYDEPCIPRLSSDDQAWATECWRSWRETHPDKFAE